MAPNPIPFSTNVAREAYEPPPATPGRDVDGIAGADTTIHIDAKTGHVRRENADGSLSVEPIGQPKKKKRAKQTFNDNLAEDMDPADLAMIASRLLERIESDIASRRDWEETAQKGAALIGVKLDEASAEIGLDGMISRVKHTGLLGACLASWANSRAELLPVGGPVKVRDDSLTDEEDILTAGLGHNGGPPLDDGPSNVVPGPGAPAAMGGIGPTPAAGAAPGAPPAPPKPPPVTPPSTSKKRDALADALEHDLNHYLTVTDKDYYPDTSRMLMSRGLLGCQFKKIYFDPLLRRPVSRWVKGTDLIVSNEATSLSGAARVTERIQMRQDIAKRLQVLGQWRDVPLVQPTTENTEMEKTVANIEGIQLTTHLPDDNLHTIFETYTELSHGILAKDEKGKEPCFPLPYRVTMDKISRVIVEIRRNWKEGDANYERRRRYVKFGHVPGLGFYDWGFVHLIGNPQRAATTIEQTLIDAGMLNSFPGGIMAKSPGTRQRTTEIRMAPGEWTVMDTGGLPISDFAMPLPYKEPSSTLAAMGQDLASQMKQIAGVVELPVGEGRIGNTPVGTIMAYVDAVTKVPSAVHKDDHIAQQEEFELLKELFAENPESLWRGAKKPARKWMVGQEIMDQDLVPAADPNVPSQTHRLMKANMLVQIAGLPQFAGIPNQRAVYENAIRTIGASNTGEFTMPQQAAPPPPPDPKIVVAQIKSQDLEKQLQAKAQESQQDSESKIEELKITSADKDADRAAENERALLKHQSETGGQKVDFMKHATGLAQDHQQHTDNMGIAGAELGQDHAQHLNELAATAQQPEPDPTDPTGGP